MNPTQTTTVNPLPNLDQMVRAIGQPVRWNILKELSDGEPRTITELAKAAGCNYDATVRNLTLLKKAGLIVQQHGKLYQIPKHYLPSSGEPLVDFGHCLLRINATS